MDYNKKMKDLRINNHKYSTTLTIRSLINLLVTREITSTVMCSKIHLKYSDRED